MKKLKYLIPLTLILTALVTLVVITSMSVNAETEGYFTYTVSDGEATITDVDTAISGDVTIPSTLGGYPVTSISYEAFSDCSSLTSIVIPDSVTSIGGSVFYGCDNLTSVYITDIEAWCGIDFYDYVSNPLYNGADLYLNNTLVTDLIIPNGVTRIADYAFYGCSSLTSVEIPDSVASIAASAFDGCSNLTSVMIGNSVTSIGWYAFFRCSSLTSIVIPDSVTSIDGGAFSDCSSLMSITIPDSVTSIGGGAFSGCSSLTNLNVESGNTKYHSNGNCIIETAPKTLIAGCQSSVIPIDDSVTSIAASAFDGCSSLMSITIPDSVTSIGSSVFSGCSSLTGIVIPDNVTSIGSSVFSGCSNLTSVTIGNGVKRIDLFAFYGCSSLTSITIPDSLKGIGDSAFSGCSSLTNIVIPDSVTNIDGYAFSGCSNLTSVTIGNGVERISRGAFDGCNALTTVYYGGNQSDWDKISISYYNEDLTNANIIFATPDMPIYTISATPEEGGTVTGAGIYEQGTGVTLKATANEGYIFKGWYENGELVSGNATFTFISEADRTLTAKFAPEAPEFLYGDVNGDGVIDMKDVILLRQYIVNYNYETGSSSIVLGPQQ